MTVKIVADSACDVPEHLARELDITIVPVYINVGEQSFLENVEISREQFYHNLPTYSVYPTTAAPAVGSFTAVYDNLAAAGATDILSIHIASSLSATFNAARLGAEAAAAPVTVFDSEQITMGSGLQVLAAAQAAAAGHSVADIVTMLRQRVPRTRVFGMIDSLESLRRSGRVNWAQFGLGTLLQIKPVMMIHRGDVSVVARIRTRKKALSHTIEMVQQFGPFERLAIIHVNAPEAAEELRQMAEGVLSSTHPPMIMGITPAIGTHLGLGAVGFACIATQDHN
ncbi:MAG: DegV family protein [Chloroflexi bacterium]|nr:DegV family protein [Chloroflexota bacterium]